ncbi:MAG TPA: GNAT family N-acetyltransferase [Bryobacteraceae bacterium]|nr:GNAT family N-acetyltransferase [Bryobacteraceae bacterium]
MTARIRRGAPEDGSFLAWVMLAASRGHLRRGVWDVLIGADEAGCLEYLRRLAVAEPVSLYHCERFLIAERDGSPAAALCGFPMRDAWQPVAIAMANVQRDLGWTEADLAASRQRAAPVWACFLPDVGATWGIENVATRPEYRRRGLMQLLLEESLREAAECGCRLAQITTFIGNDAALAGYRKSGFRIADEKRSDEFAAVLGSPGFVRLLRDL